VKHDDDPRLDRLVERMLASATRVTATPEREAYDRHVADALTGEAAVRGEPAGPLVDVGSGGGVPGLVLAVRFPERAVTLVEATGRKAAFLRETAAALGLDNVRVVPLRAEDLAAREREGFGVATARALAPPVVAAELCLPLVRLGGLFLLYAGSFAEPPFAAAVALLGGRVEAIDPVAGSDRRQLVRVRKVEPTPPRFPRRVGVAAKRPLVRFT
jgi:16S rRNA (guanine527-N7)-methyltransferase